VASTRGGRKTGWSTAAQEVVDRVFAYGTLRQGQPPRSLIADHVARAAPATLAGRIHAFDAGYPGLVAGGDDRVVGEVVWLTDLAAAFALLDAYEGDDFERVLHRARLDSGEEIWAWCYVLVDPTMAAAGALIADGDWVAHLGRGRT
jgi:gamma-glutamylcyclotransferase (GGCT)/AIG2-like uncharacterized protein YtfP